MNRSRRCTHPTRSAASSRTHPRSRAGAVHGASRSRRPSLSPRYLIVNAYDFLLARAKACRRQRGMIPNLVAVDFYRTGDLIRVVDALNGVEDKPLATAPPARSPSKPTG